MGNGNYFELNTFFDFELMKLFKCKSNVRGLGSVRDCASECILNLLKAFYFGGGNA